MYNKLFSKILDSSIWLEPDSTRIVWMTLLASMDEDGFCAFACAANVVHRAIVPLEKAEEALKALESPDPNSADPDHEGRRIERVPGGWLVLNAPKYRELATREKIRESNRNRAQAFRDRKRNDRVTPRNVSSCNQSKSDQSIKTSCAELDEPASAPPVFLLPCKGKGPQECPVSSEQVREWADAFPAVDVLAELKKAKAWLNANPTRGKTHRGMAKFIVGWLTREQDKGRPAGKQNSNGVFPVGYVSEGEKRRLKLQEAEQ